MKSQANVDLLEMAQNSHESLLTRIRSLQELGTSGDRTFVAGLKTLLGRPRPEAQQRTKNWDPQAAERVVDLYILAALHTLGDDSELQRIPILIRQAGDLLLGPDDELQNAAFVIRSIGRLEPISAIVGLASDKDARAWRNAVRTLDQLDLPEAPLGGSVSSVPHMSDKVTFTIRRLKEELEGLEQHSRGSIVLSPGVAVFLAGNDYDRGTVRRQDVPLSDIVEKTIPLLDFDYYVENGHVIICTFAEAGVRWRGWWNRYGGELEYQKAKSLFVLRKGK